MKYKVVRKQKSGEMRSSKFSRSHWTWCSYVFDTN